MTRKTEIEMEIKENGDVEFKIKGVKGKGCLRYEELLVELLGRVQSRKLTSEYYEQEVKIKPDIHGKVTK